MMRGGANIITITVKQEIKHSPSNGAITNAVRRSSMSETLISGKRWKLAKMLGFNRSRYSPPNGVTANVELGHVDLVKVKRLNCPSISQTLRAIATRRHLTFREVDIRHRRHLRMFYSVIVAFILNEKHFLVMNFL